jgi:hypothetical protein
MTSISDAAWIVLDYALDGGPSGLDEDTITWSKSTAAELERILAAIQKSPAFGSELITAMAGSSREVSLLAVELTALALLPLRHPGPELEALFGRLIRIVAGPPLVMPPTLLEGIRGLGFRPAGPGDSLPARLLYLAAYVKACQSCPDYDALLERGDDEYLGHEDLHDKCLPELIIESPWACAEVSDLVRYENLGMQCDLDHMLWPEFLAPLPIRLAGELIRDEYADLLQGDSGNSMIAIQKDLYLVKQLMGSWGEIHTKSDDRPL